MWAHARWTSETDFDTPHSLDAAPATPPIRHHPPGVWATTNGVKSRGELQGADVDGEIKTNRELRCVR